MPRRRVRRDRSPESPGASRSKTACKCRPTPEAVPARAFLGRPPPLAGSVEGSLPPPPAPWCGNRTRSHTPSRGCRGASRNTARIRGYPVRRRRDGSLPSSGSRGGESARGQVPRSPGQGARNEALLTYLNSSCTNSLRTSAPLAPKLDYVSVLPGPQGSLSRQPLWLRDLQLVNIGFLVHTAPPASNRCR